MTPSPLLSPPLSFILTLTPRVATTQPPSLTFITHSLLGLLTFLPLGSFLNHKGMAAPFLDTPSCPKYPPTWLFYSTDGKPERCICNLKACSRTGAQAFLELYGALLHSADPAHKAEATLLGPSKHTVQTKGFHLLPTKERASAILAKIKVVQTPLVNPLHTPNKGHFAAGYWTTTLS
jgi:hypothetical protein